MIEKEEMNMIRENNFDKNKFDKNKFDREVPNIKPELNRKKVRIFLFLLFSSLALILIFFNDINKNSKRIIDNPHKKDTYHFPNNLDEPYITYKNSNKKKDTGDTKTTNSDDLKNSTHIDELAFQKEALKLAREYQEQLKLRKHSPQIIVDEKPKIRKKTTNQKNTLNQDSSYAHILQDQDNLITQGTIINAILETAIQSDLSGMTRAVTRKNTYSFNRKNLLIPKGSVLIGNYKNNITQGQSRLAIEWTRIITPEGKSITLKAQGTDDLGRTGLAGNLDTKFFKRFGNSLLLTLIDGGIDIAANSTQNDNTENITVQTGQNLTRSSEIALRNSINIPPTISIDQGTLINVFVNQDLIFSNKPQVLFSP